MPRDCVNLIYSDVKQGVEYVRRAKVVLDGDPMDEHRIQRAQQLLADAILAMVDAGFRDDMPQKARKKRLL